MQINTRFIYKNKKKYTCKLLLREIILGPTILLVLMKKNKQLLYIADNQRSVK